MQGLQPGGQRTDQVSSVDGFSQPVNRFGVTSNQVSDIESTGLGKVS